MLVSPSKRQRLAADAQPADQRQSMTSSQFRDAAVGFLSSRLVDSSGTQAATLQLRPSLQKVHDDLVAVLDNAVQLKQNASLLVIGEPGIGKTMVSSTRRSSAGNRSCVSAVGCAPRMGGPGSKNACCTEGKQKV